MSPPRWRILTEAGACGGRVEGRAESGLAREPGTTVARVGSWALESRPYVGRMTSDGATGPAGPGPRDHPPLSRAPSPGQPPDGELCGPGKGGLGVTVTEALVRPCGPGPHVPLGAREEQAPGLSGTVSCRPRQPELLTCWPPPPRLCPQGGGPRPAQAGAHTWVLSPHRPRPRWLAPGCPLHFRLSSGVFSDRPVGEGCATQDPRLAPASAAGRLGVARPARRGVLGTSEPPAPCGPSWC